MIRHLFRLVWNRKKRNLLLMFEIFCSFLVLFYLMSILVSFTTRYMTPLGYDYEGVWVLSLGHEHAGESVSEEQQKNTLQQVVLELKSHPEIMNYSLVSGCLPYGRSVWSSSIDLDGKEYHPTVLLADTNFAKTMGLTISNGRWFTSPDLLSNTGPLIVSRDLYDEITGDTIAIGRRFVKDDSVEVQLIGVVDNYRFRGDFENTPGFWFRFKQNFDSVGVSMPDNIMLRVGSSATGRFEQQILENLKRIAPQWSPRIETLVDRRSSYIRDNLFRLLGMGSVAGFLVLNVALGLFGVLWYSINRRRSEIALRRALGADRQGIAGQIIGEALVLASLAMLIGLFFAVQVPLLGFDSTIGLGEYLMAMLLSVLAIYTLVLVCSYYPGWLGMRIHPAQALRDE